MSDEVNEFLVGDPGEDEPTETITLRGTRHALARVIADLGCEDDLFEEGYGEAMAQMEELIGHELARWGAVTLPKTTSPPKTPAELAANITGRIQELNGLRKALANMVEDGGPEGCAVRLALASEYEVLGEDGEFPE